MHCRTQSLEDRATTSRAEREAAPRSIRSEGRSQGSLLLMRPMLGFARKGRENIVDGHLKAGLQDLQRNPTKMGHHDRVR